ncbi:MAG: hypothetical protein DPW16_11075 [Chloroflexi bacterium]|nr:hypothetical protein [Chloroflexota bacterium]
MNHQQSIDAVARRLYRFSRRDVAEIMEVLVEVWREELLRPEGNVHIRGLGNLYIQLQQIEASGLAKQLMEQADQPGGMVTRSYFRFRPTRALKRDLAARIRSGEFVE